MKRTVRAVLRREGAAAGDWSVVFADGKTVRKMNRVYLKERGDTDVIAFPYDSPRGAPRSGDIVISLSCARDNARRFGEPLRRELVRLIVHGVLHVLGYRDDRRDAKMKMWRRQEELVDRLVPKETR